MEFLPWLILLSPLASAACILLFAHRSKPLSVTLSLAAVLTAFGATLALLASGSQTVASSVDWIHLGPSLHLTIGLKVDALTRVMLLVVTGIGALVHIYSTVYMAEDEGKSRFFGSLSLFMFSMLGIVLADSLTMIFIFWELVGVSSFLLIGHWFTKESAAKAANKAPPPGKIPSIEPIAVPRKTAGNMFLKSSLVGNKPVTLPVKTSRLSSG